MTEEDEDPVDADLGGQQVPGPLLLHVSALYRWKV